MSWKWFAPFLLAAAWVGAPVQAPRLADPIPLLRDPRCDYPGALDFYLLAYAYAQEHADVARKFLAAAARELSRCEGDTTTLTERLQGLKAALP